MIPSIVLCEGSTTNISSHGDATETNEKAIVGVISATFSESSGVFSCSPSKVVVVGGKTVIMAPVLNGRGPCRKDGT